MSREIEDWLDALGLGSYIVAFQRSSASPAAIAALNDVGLQQLGIASPQARQKILSAIAAGQLPRNVSASTQPATQNVPGATLFSGASDGVGPTSDSLAGTTEFGEASAGSAPGDGELAGVTQFAAGAAGQVPMDALAAWGENALKLLSRQLDEEGLVQVRESLQRRLSEVEGLLGER